MNDLSNKTIGIASDRQSEAIAALIRKHGGEPAVYSIQGERIYNQQVCFENIHVLIRDPFDWVILTTGIGARTLEKAAQEMNQAENFLRALKNRKLAIRGSKTLNWLKSHDLVPERVSPDGTMAQLFSIFEADGKQTAESRIYLQVYDEDEAELKQALETSGYSVYLSKPYRYKEPEEQVLSKLTRQVTDRALDAVVFTSKTQVRNLFNQPDRKAQLVQAFNDHVLAVAIGKVTAQEIAYQGVEHLIQPENPKMGAMIVALGKYYEGSAK
ncbi:uroporphyrinogen-III synthase [Sporolactobacillus sp. THM7-4]|nr:uroporphyrinogen-III synthase [Sporolactobacillus sp. THM7-4]